MSRKLPPEFVETPTPPSCPLFPQFSGKRVRYSLLESYPVRSHNSAVASAALISNPETPNQNLEAISLANSPFSEDFGTAFSEHARGFYRKFRPMFLGTMEPIEGIKFKGLMEGPEESVIGIGNDERLRWISKPDTMNDQFLHETRSKLVSSPGEEIKSWLSLPNLKESKFYLAFKSGKIACYDHIRVQKESIEENGPEIVGMTDSGMGNSSDSIVCARNDGTIIFYENRVKGAIATVSTDLTEQSCICSWPSAKEIIGIGSLEGFVSIFDTRMMAPIFREMTEPVRQIVAVPCSTTYHGIAFAISSYDKVVIHHKSSNVLNFNQMTIQNHGKLTGECYNGKWERKGKFPVLTEWKSGVITADIEKVVYMDSLQKEKSYELYDRGIIKPLDRPQDLYGPLSSLHQHSSRILSMTQSGRAFYSSDSNGFVNMWRIEK